MEAARQDLLQAAQSTSKIVLDVTSSKTVRVSKESIGVLCTDGSKNKCLKARNSLNDKRRMRNERKKRKRLMRAQQRRCHTATAKGPMTTTTAKDEAVHKQMQEYRKEAGLYKHMAKTYWERWRWEVERRKDAIRETFRPHYCATEAKSQKVASIHEINPDDLNDPVVQGTPEEVYVGRGSFSVVRLQVYRGMKVAVKEFLPRTHKQDVRAEADILAKLCHPFLPFLFGVCESSNPIKIVIQFHGIDNETITIGKQLTHHPLTISTDDWLVLISQVFDALAYLHVDLHILHNDIKQDNILITEERNGNLATYHIVLIDFGKATTIQAGRHYTLTNSEQLKYMSRYPHIAPEVVLGENKQSTFSDIYATGKIISKIANGDQLSLLSSKANADLKNLYEKCISRHYMRRPNAEKCLEIINKLIIT